jgi:hypothetical protein
LNCTHCTSPVQHSAAQQKRAEERETHLLEVVLLIYQRVLVKVVSQGGQVHRSLHYRKVSSFYIRIDSYYGVEEVSSSVLAGVE